MDIRQVTILTHINSNVNAEFHPILVPMKCIFLCVPEFAILDEFWVRIHKGEENSTNKNPISQAKKVEGLTQFFMHILTY
jgi:hypothetical protein